MHGDLVPRAITPNILAALSDNTRRGRQRAASELPKALPNRAKHSPSGLTTSVNGVMKH
jgi:hypothetical protein